MNVLGNYLFKHLLMNINKSSKETLDPKENVVYKGIEDLKDLLEIGDLKGLQEMLGFREKEGLRGFKVLQENKDLKENRACQVLLVEILIRKRLLYS